MIIQIIGQAGSGKTTLAIELADRINGVHINADKVLCQPLLLFGRQLLKSLSTIGTKERGIWSIGAGIQKKCRVQ